MWWFNIFTPKCLRYPQMQPSEHVAASPIGNTEASATHFMGAPSPHTPVGARGEEHLPPNNMEKVRCPRIHRHPSMLNPADPHHRWISITA